MYRFVQVKIYRIDIDSHNLLTLDSEQSLNVLIRINTEETISLEIRVQYFILIKKY